MTRAPQALIRAAQEMAREEGTAYVVVTTPHTRGHVIRRYTEPLKGGEKIVYQTIAASKFFGEEQQ